MKVRLLTSWFAGLLALAAAEPGDLLRFSNGDQLHGTFRGIKDGSAIWIRDDVANPVEFKTTQLRHVVLRGGHPVKALASLSHVALVNGDRVAGKIVALDDENVILETSYAGTLHIPRRQVAMLAPSPLGGRLRYHGPFNDDGWKMAHAAFPDGLPPEKTGPPAAENSDEKGDQADDKTDDPGRWIFSGSAWYWANKSFGTALYRDQSMPDRAIVRFDVAWKNRLSLAVAFHSDYAKAKPAEKVEGAADKPGGRPNGFVAGDSGVLPVLFGNSYVLQIFSTHMMLCRTSVEGDGMPVERLQINGNAVRLGDAGKATVELRCNRQSGEIAVFINDEFVVQWNEGGPEPGDTSHYAGKGAGIGFAVQTEDSQVKISDILIAEWNGMPDSARSLQTDEQDIVLLANGTDRFSGKVESFHDGKVALDGKYGHFFFDLDDIAEIRFARNHLDKASTVPPDQVVVRLSPLGQITGRPLSGTADSLRLLSPVCGEINLNLDPAIMLDFKISNNFIDDWDADF